MLDVHDSPASFRSHIRVNRRMAVVSATETKLLATLGCWQCLTLFISLKGTSSLYSLKGTSSLYSLNPHLPLRGKLLSNVAVMTDEAVLFNHVIEI